MTKRLDLLLQRNTPVVPALYFEQASIERGPDHKMPQAVIDSLRRRWKGRKAPPHLKAGGRLGMGGDYGFAWNPHGDYAKELSFFVNYVGFHSAASDTCATKTGAEIMGRGDEFGTLETGKLGDVLVVDGVATDISLLENRGRTSSRCCKGADGGLAMSKAFDFIREYRRWIGAILMCIAIAVFIPSFSSYRRMQRVLQAVGAQGAFAVAEFQAPTG
ncbi:MAG: hypothetical protein U0992_11770 [Planctomycetaceae bacterium]